MGAIHLGKGLATGLVMTWDGKILIGISHSTTSLIDNSATMVPNSIVIHIQAVQLQTIHHSLQCMSECCEEEEEEWEEEEEEEEEEEGRRRGRR